MPQGRQIYPKLSVADNLRVGLEATRPRIKRIPKHVYDMFPILWDNRQRPGGNLSGGMQQQLAIARALVSKPSVLLLDEPTEGIQPNIIQHIGEVLQSLVKSEESPVVARAIDEAAEKYRLRVERTREAVGQGERVGAAWVVDGRSSKRKLDRTQALLLAQERAVYGLFLGEDGRLSLATDMRTPIDLTEVFGTRGGMQNRITLPLQRLAEVLAFVEGQD